MHISHLILDDIEIEKCNLLSVTCLKVSHKENRKFDLKLFRKQSLKIAFDALYGLPNDHIAIHELVELIAYLHFDGKIEQGSKFEVQMNETVIKQLKNNEELFGNSRRTLSLIWIYFMAHARIPSGASIKVQKTLDNRFVTHKFLNSFHFSPCSWKKVCGHSIVKI